jgi:uncharacterized RDD family membrane protein YckC
VYPSLLRRYLSTVIDYAVMLGLLFAFAKSSLYDPNAVEATLWPMWIFVVYEPVLTTVACTPGQLAMNFRVRRVSGFGRPAIHRTFLRWLVKGLLGVVSVLFLPRQKQRRALHDLASGTIVLNGAGPFGAPPNKSLERTRGE